MGLLSLAIVSLTWALTVSGLSCPNGYYPNQLCCVSLTSYDPSWGPSCGLYSTNTTAQYGKLCFRTFGSCYDGRLDPAAMCCHGGLVEGPDGRCILGDNCVRAFGYRAGSLPDGWSIDIACAVDVPERIFVNAITTQYTDNTPYNCASRCQAAGYAYAGVEYANECTCGTGYTGPVTTSGNYQCDLPCTGDGSLSCGGSWRIQTFKYTAPA